MKVAFLFPGQGAQYIGMGRELYETFPVVQEVFNQGNLPFDIKKLCFEGPDEELANTQYTQPCLVTLELAIAKLLNHFGIYADVCAGLSLGEYSAIAYAGGLDIETAISLVHKRGKLMEQAIPAGVGAMAAIIGLDKELVELACTEASSVGVVEIANYNCPGQLVISGLKESVEKASVIAKEKGARRVIPLKVSGPFHTSLLKEAGHKLREELNKVMFTPLNIPVVFNVTGNYEEIPMVDLLEEQIQSSVQFEKTIQLMLNEGVEVFIEVGPSKTLSSFVRKINRQAKVYHVEDKKTLDNLLIALGKESKYE